MGSGLRSGKGRRLWGSTSRERTEGAEPQPGVRMLEREEGQGLVEFALIVPLFMTIVIGILSFGIGLNYWLDMNRAANKGARQAIVNHWPPQCPRGAVSCTNSGSATPCSAVLATNSRARLQDVLRCRVRNDPAATVCYPGKAPADVTIGDPVRVKLTAPYTFFFMRRLGITLTATATTRLEQRPKLITGAGGPACT
jgi:hypothetical protein